MSPQPQLIVKENSGITFLLPSLNFFLASNSGSGPKMTFAIRHTDTLNHLIFGYYLVDPQPISQFRVYRVGEEALS